MATRTKAPVGAPCWVDLWTSDVGGAQEFYSQLLGWEAQEPSEEFGGYFMFHRDGVPIAGGMGDMGDMRANDTWKVYLCVEDAKETFAVAGAQGAELFGDPMPVADLGIQGVLTDPTGASVGAWQPGTFPGFSVLGEPGAPAWFELLTHDFDRAVEFYRSVFGWELDVLSDTEAFRYTVARDADGNQFAGVMDASKLPSSGAPSMWTVYWDVDSVDAAAMSVVKLGGTVQDGPVDTDYGRMVFATDPFGARFNLHSST